MSSSNRIYGIDLGTTYSAISFVNEDGKPELIDNPDGSPITASAVYFEAEDNIVVGDTAKEQGKIDSTGVVELIKREMGEEWRQEFHGQTYTPEGVSACILGYLVKGAERAGHEVKDVIITCPAYFGTKEREATRAAGRIAGLNVIAILDEPVAAAICYGVYNEQDDRNILVYDLGGGTFDVTILHMEKGALSTVCTDGNHRLGGADWDQRLENMLAGKFMESCPGAGDPMDDPDSRYELHHAAEVVKKKLSNSKSTSVAVSHNGEKAKVTISREEFEAATSDLLNETLDFTDKMLRYAREEKGIERIDSFLLVGGSTFMPQVINAVTERYQDALGVTPIQHDPNQAVAKGAALCGVMHKLRELLATNTDSHEIATLTGIPEDKLITLAATRLRKVASKSYGIRARKGDKPIIFNLIMRQDAVPCKATHTFPISEANAAILPLCILSNDSTEKLVEPELGEIAGEATMELTPGLPAGAPISVTFELSEEGTLSLTAVDTTNNKELHTTFNAPGSLTEEEIEQQQKAIEGTLCVD